jgi:tol-pal system protein YbgF
VAVVALALSGCGGVARPATEAPARPAAAASEQPPRPAADQARDSEQLSRIAGELAELQNALAKVIASSRQQDEQLAFLRRRLEDLESQNRGRPPAAPGGFVPAPGGFAPAPGGFAPPPGGSAPMPSGVAPAPSSVAAAPPPGPLPLQSTATPAAALYRAGTEQLQARNFDAATLSFYDLIVSYPHDPLREGAQFMVADIFFAQQDYRGALAEFEALIAAVPLGDRVPDALLRIGQCQKRLGENGRAKRTWERIVRDHPSSVAARQARVLLKN